MNRQEIVTALTREINRLTSARTLLEDAPQTTTTTTNNSNVRVMSAEGRRRIALAQKRRWAKLKKAA